MSTYVHKKIIDKICAGFDNDRSRMMDICIDVQDRLHCIDGNSMDSIANALGCSRVEVEGVVSFYAFFSRERKGDITIRLCDDIIDRHAGMEKISKVFQQELGISVGETSEDNRFSLDYTPCIGMCDQAPAALINNTVVTSLSIDSARRIARDLKGGAFPEDLFDNTGDGNNAHPLVQAMVKNNIRKPGAILLGDVPADKGIAKSVKMSPPSIIEEIESAGLRGYGGAGFPTGRKWKFAAAEKNDVRYIFCNADEGEPGTFKDRVLLTERPDLVFEGMTVCARAIGSEIGIIYLRGEYAYLQAFLEHVLQERRDKGLLGKNILGLKGFTFDIRIQMGAGSYVCGAESALISSCEGLPGEPKTRPPYPVQSGYFGKPSVVNNVETFAAAARIMDIGADAFRELGTEKSPGTKLLSVCGDCERPGVYELPYGLTVQELLDMVGARDPAAVQMSGPSGELIGRNTFDRRICYEDLPTGGSVMVFAPNRNILEIVDYFLGFFVEESCGFCTPCRVGNVFLKERIGKIRKGNAEPADLDYLLELSNTIIKTSRCGLGQTSPNPVITSILNFPLVYAAVTKECEDGMQAGFDIQAALEESRRLAKRHSVIYDEIYEDA